MPGSRSVLLLSLIRPLLLCYLIYKSLETAAPLTLYPSPLTPQPLDPKELKCVANNFYYQDARSSYRELPYTTNTVLSQLIFSSNTTMRDIAPTTFFTHRQKFRISKARKQNWNDMIGTQCLNGKMITTQGPTNEDGLLSTANLCPKQVETTS